LASLTTDIVKKSEGLPLTLEVLGQYLKKKRNAEDWKQTLAALHEADHVEDFNERLWMKLRPSVENLEENAKQMFLDATTFFYGSGWTLKKALAAWRAAYGVKERLLWQTLVDRVLVYVVEDDEPIKVHEQLRSLGRKMAKETKGNNKGRLVETAEALELLQRTNELHRQVCVRCSCQITS
jgi:hypothetical protein